MNHDYAHCWDYKKGVCPTSCFRAVITEELKNWPYPVAFSRFKESGECPLTHPITKPTHADEIRAMTDEELAKFLSNIRGGCRALTTGSYVCDFYSDNLDTDCKACWLEWLKQEAGGDIV